MPAKERASRKPFRVYHRDKSLEFLGHPIVAYTASQAVFRYFKECVGAFPPAWRGEYDAREISWDEYHDWKRSVAPRSRQLSLF